MDESNKIENVETTNQANESNNNKTTSEEKNKEQNESTNNNDINSPSSPVAASQATEAEVAIAKEATIVIPVETILTETTIKSTIEKEEENKLATPSPPVESEIVRTVSPPATNILTTVANTMDDETDEDYDDDDYCIGSKRLKIDEDEKSSSNIEPPVIESKNNEIVAASSSTTITTTTINTSDKIAEEASVQIEAIGTNDDTNTNDDEIKTTKLEIIESIASVNETESQMVIDTSSATALTPPPRPSSSSQPPSVPSNNDGELTINENQETTLNTTSPANDNDTTKDLDMTIASNEAVKDGNEDSNSKQTDISTTSSCMATMQEDQNSNGANSSNGNAQLKVPPLRIIKSKGGLVIDENLKEQNKVTLELGEIKKEDITEDSNSNNYKENPIETARNDDNSIKLEKQDVDNVNNEDEKQIAGVVTKEKLKQNKKQEEKTTRSSLTIKIQKTTDSSTDNIKYESSTTTTTTRSAKLNSEKALTSSNGTKRTREINSQNVKVKESDSVKSSNANSVNSSKAATSNSNTSTTPQTANNVIRRKLRSHTRQQQGSGTTITSTSITSTQHQSSNNSDSNSNDLIETNQDDSDEGVKKLDDVEMTDNDTMMSTSSNNDNNNKTTGKNGESNSRKRKLRQQQQQIVDNLNDSTSQTSNLSTCNTTTTTQSNSTTSTTTTASVSSTSTITVSSSSSTVTSCASNQTQQQQQQRSIINTNNCIKKFIEIRNEVLKRRESLRPIAPDMKLPQNYEEFSLYKKSYLIKDNKEAFLSIPFYPTPTEIPDEMRVLYNDQEKQRYNLRIRHHVEQDKLIILYEHEALRCINQTYREYKNQTIPLSFCSIIKDDEIYSLQQVPPPQQQQQQQQDQQQATTDNNNNDDENDKNILLTLKQNINDIEQKFKKLKDDLIKRQLNESDSLHAVQLMDWQSKFKQISNNKIINVNNDDINVPFVDVNSNFELTTIIA